MKHQSIYVILILLFEGLLLFLISGTMRPVFYLAGLVLISFLHHYYVKKYNPYFAIILSSVTLFLLFTIPNHNNIMYLWCVLALHIWYLNFSLSREGKTREPLMKTMIMLSGFIPCWYAVNAVSVSNALQTIFLSLGSFSVLVLCWLSVQADFNKKVKPTNKLILKLMLILSFALLLSFSAGRMIYTKVIRGLINNLYQSLNFDMGKMKRKRSIAGRKTSDEFKLNNDSSKNSRRVSAFLQQKRKSGEVLLRTPVYLRQAGFSEFTGSKWLGSKANKDNWILDEDDGRHDGWTILGMPKTNLSANYIVYLTETNTSSVFCLPGTVAVALPGVLKGNDQTYRMYRRKRNMIAYAAHSYLLKYSDIILRDLKIGTTGSKYLHLPDSDLLKRLKKDVAKITVGKADLSGKINSIRNYMNTEYTYKLKTSTQKQRILENFLYGDKTGNCTVFATVFALYLRASGIPARVGTGYCSSTYDADNDVFVFFNDDAHAWTEVCFQEYGWVIIDASPSSGFVAKGDRDHGFMDRRDDYNFLSAADDTAFGFNPFYFINQQLLQRTRYYFYILILICSVASFFFLIFKNFSKFKKLKFSNIGRKKKVSELIFYSMFCQLFADKGCKRKKGETGAEYLSRLKGIKFIENEFDDMLAYYYSVKYENNKHSSEYEKKLVYKIKQMKNK